ncbi:pyruvate dehydrogenase E2 component (dihydrolipoamide acetyltransferase) [Catalinimonas alkaloidigena]|uniref:pyruvate dehydrogenase complex dihydrolipoamide acetyltransferase n=1 Tax=Catalinimonas alkaloidigena TaxID=1075417 RepID=UPI0024058F21|nr:pyruvate dehydrogenase complex dihydrolipoamide acetyltransferase [Catalinimonas alkaloidigena]MDF9796757.1 pyruvate dehydrogenase E2 component (dihydrolipoamide acetyltransferase) [Catalinimonas alkaloidigena]
MAEVIRMPKMSDTMEEGVIASWQKKVGDKVESGDILAEVETDKATMELESFEDGTLLYIGVKENEAVPVDGVIAIIGEEGEEIDSLLKQIESGSSTAPDKEEETDQADVSEEGEDEEVDTSDVNATVVTMPKMSDTMTEGVIASWLKKVGDKVESGDILAEVETDKATMELESYEDGILLYVGVEEGGAVEIDGVIAVIGEEGADYEKLLKANKSKKKGGEEPKEEKSSSSNGQDKAEEKDAPAYTPTHAEESSLPSSSDGGRVKASPLAKKMAEDKGYDISKIPGTGENGRVVKKDIESYKPSKSQPVAQPDAAQKDTAKQAAPVKLPEVVGEERYEEVNVSQMRKTIARRLAESKFTAPHFYLTMEIDMEKAIAARKSMNEIAQVKISFNDIVVKAVAAALRQHPKVNVSWRGDKMRFNQHINIGIAVAVEEGLLVPVVRFADNKTISHISAEVKDLANKAKNKQLQPKDWEGSTFTISNLGMFGIEEFTAIVNPPDACILAVGGIKETPVVKNGQIVPGNVMKVTLSCDHRAVDGALGAAFLQTFKAYMEDPIRILV